MTCTIALLARHRSIDAHRDEALGDLVENEAHPPVLSLNPRFAIEDGGSHLR
jgi:hypothetical protein